MVMRYLYTSLNMTARVKNLNEQFNIPGILQTISKTAWPTSPQILWNYISFVTHFETLTFDSNFSSLETILSQSSDCTLLETWTVML
jgi:hypothetical protein